MAVHVLLKEAQQHEEGKEQERERENMCAELVVHMEARCSIYTTSFKSSSRPDALVRTRTA